MSSISAISGMSSYYSNLIPAAQAAQTGSAKEEFLAMFYKELLKQTVKVPDLSFKSEDETEPSYNVASSFGSEALIDQLADQLARKMAVQLGWNSATGEAGK